MPVQLKLLKRERPTCNIGETAAETSQEREARLQHRRDRLRWYSVERQCPAHLKLLKRERPTCNIGETVAETSQEREAWLQHRRDRLRWCLATDYSAAESISTDIIRIMCNGINYDLCLTTIILLPNILLFREHPAIITFNVLYSFTSSASHMQPIYTDGRLHCTYNYIHWIAQARPTMPCIFSSYKL